MEFRASHILVKERQLAEDLRKRILKGANFAALARDFSTCPSKSKGGDLGWFTEGAMVKPFEEAVKRMSVGSISPVVATQFGFHVIKKTGSR
ncbi:MAG: peptidylprolyl isomerase [Sphaerochaetaceae bacterium]